MNIIENLGSLDKKSKGLIIKAYRKEFGLSMQTYQRKKIANTFSEVELAFLQSALEEIKVRAIASAKRLTDKETAGA